MLAAWLHLIHFVVNSMQREEMEDRKAYDWSPELKTALVADDDFNNIEYVALDRAPAAAPNEAVGYMLLPLLHSLAYARLLGGFMRSGDYVQAKKWERFSQMRKEPALPEVARRRERAN